MALKPAPGAASIIIPCWNQLDFTRQCMAALLRHTHGPWELIVIDNGSTDGTAAYLANLRDAAPLPVTLISNTRNRGFPAAINQGLKCARGDYLVLLNNDTVVTEGWLNQLIALASIAPRARQENSPGGTAPETPNAAHKQTSEAGPQAPSEIRNAYPGRDITVIDLAPGSQNGNAPSRPHQAPPGTPANPQSKIALVGPMSNYAPPPQLVEEVSYRDLTELYIFARQWRDQHRGKWLPVRKLSGFCVLMKRSVYEAIGGLDERFGLGFFDDDDLAERARRAGFELAVACDLFVHHFGSRTFAGNGVNADKLLDENAAKFAAKWGSSVPDGHRITLRPFAPKPQPPMETIAAPRPAEPIAPSPPTARISLTMIVKNEEANLPNALESVRGLFDEIVVVDTGSTDRTVAIARDFGARVAHFAWIDDFAAARNVALANATGDYAFWLDADDVVEPPERRKLEELLNRIRTAQPPSPPAGSSAGLNQPQPVAYVLDCACDPGPGGSGGRTIVNHVRLFPRLEGVRWTYKVHEQILPALRRRGVAVQWTGITIRHTGYTDRALRAKKLERDVRILVGELGERPNDPFILFNLGMIAVERKQWQNASTYLERSLAGSAPTDSITRKLFALLARVQETMGDTAAALRTCAEGLSLDPEDAELWFRKGMAHRHRGERDDAESAWRRILSLRRPEKFASVDQGIYGHVTRRNLAELARERGNYEESARLWREVLAECPGDRDALRNLGMEGT